MSECDCGADNWNRKNPVNELTHTLNCSTRFPTPPPAGDATLRSDTEAWLRAWGSSSGYPQGTRELFYRWLAAPERAQPAAPGVMNKANELLEIARQSFFVNGGPTQAEALDAIAAALDAERLVRVELEDAVLALLDADDAAISTDNTDLALSQQNYDQAVEDLLKLGTRIRAARSSEPSRANEVK
jgi:hypothetical protein